MPGFITHYIAGKSTQKSISQDIRDYITPINPLFNLGTQGPDIFFYYISGFITRRIKNVGTQMHNGDLGRFFMGIADILKQSKSQSERKLVFAYTAGFLVHYAVDVHTHPYVYAQTYDPPTPKIKETTRHRHFETSIDVLMLRRFYDRRPSDYKLWKLISPEKLHMRAAAAATSDAIRQVYNRDINPCDVYHAMEQMAHFTRHMQSKNGRRKRLLQGIENITAGSHVFSALIHPQEVTDNRDYLNTKNTPWSPPWAPDKTRTESFVDLFESAVHDAAQMIQALYSYMNNSLSHEQLAAQIRNCSLKTGVCDSAPKANWLAPRNHEKCNQSKLTCNNKLTYPGETP